MIAIAVIYLATVVAIVGGMAGSSDHSVQGVRWFYVMLALVASGVALAVNQLLAA